MRPELVLTLKSREGLESLNELKTATDKGKTIDVDLRAHRNRRSLDANAFCWVTLSKMAAVLHTTKDELYLIMLKRYGQFTYVIVKNEAVEMFTRAYRLTEDKGKTKDGTGTQLLCYFGSSEYDTLQMSRLLDGVIQEAHEIGVETPTRSEIELMKSQWK